MRKDNIKFGLLLITLLIPFSSWSRPEYANRVKTNCSACHYNPTGGGPRTVFGKTYGSHGFSIAKSSLKDLIYGDFRALYFLPEKPLKSKNGAALMKASLAVNIEIEDNDEKKMSALFHYDLGLLSHQPVREAYIKWATKESKLIIGRFYLPFGLLTDEHRTYTKIQINTSLRNFELGALYSNDLMQELHYDVSLTNGLRSSGGDFTENGDQTFAINVNFRWNPIGKSFLLGSSILHQASQKYRPQPLATSIYGVWALDQMWAQLPKIDVLSEVVLADGFNQGEFNPWIPIYFTGEHQTWNDNLQLSQSLGLLLKLKWTINNHWKLHYKFDRILLDSRFGGDQFTRHGLGFGYQWSSNSSLSVRLEKAFVGRDDFNTDRILAAQNAIHAVFRTWF